MDIATLREWASTLESAAELVAYEGYKDTAEELLAIRDRLGSLADHPEVKP
jgi:hypothetical protein